MDEQKNILSVSQLNATARLLLEQSFNQVWIEGEISNLSQPSSGHSYFTLKDSNAQVRCALFRLHRQKLKFNLENGLQVLLRAEVSLYEARGDYQLIVSHAEPAGDGLLQRAFEALKKKLEAEGLFLEAHKKPIPKFPKQIGVITSATGAAIRDILQVLKRRFASIPVIIYPAQVQGERAASQLIQAIKIANERQECDVLILTRGGGSLEDLWPFNDEKLAYAIFKSDIPMVSAVGHEIDFTVADFVADMRAPTPSAAAELVSPNSQDYLHRLTQFSQRITQLIRSTVQHAHLQLTNLSKGLQHPGQRLKDQAQRLDLLEQALVLAQKNLLRHDQAQLNQLIIKFNAFKPILKIEQLKKDLLNFNHRLSLQIQHQLQKAEQQLKLFSNKLDAFSPLRTLERGYAIVTKTSDQSIVRNATQVKKGDIIDLRLAKDEIKARVE